MTAITQLERLARVVNEVKIARGDRSFTVTLRIKRKRYVGEARTLSTAIENATRAMWPETLGGK